MSLIRFMVLPIGIWLVAIAYWLFSGEAAGAVMLGVFGGAMAVMGWILVPTVNNVGPTAPIDPDFKDSGH